MFDQTCHSKRALSPTALLLVVLANLACGGNVSAFETVTINFDDLRPTYNGYSLAAPVPATYQGFEWYELWCLNTSYGRWDGWGYGSGVVSGRNIAYNPAYADVTMFSRSLPFDLNSAYVTSALLETMQVEVRGFANGALIYDNTYTVQKAAPTLISFDYREIQRVEFIRSDHSIFVIDDIVVTIPEPSTIALLMVGVLFTALRLVDRSRT